MALATLMKPAMLAPPAIAMQAFFAWVATWCKSNQSNPAPRAHLYFAPSTATGISVE